METPTTRQESVLYMEEEGDLLSLNPKEDNPGNLTYKVLYGRQKLKYTEYYLNYIVRKIHPNRYYSNGNNYYGGSSTYYCNSDRDCTGNLKCCYSYGQQQCTYPHYSGGVGITNGGIGFGR